MTERTCIICRSKAGKEELLRLVVHEGTLAIDECCSMPGRGAYVHRTAACISRMGPAARWERALRLEAGTLDGRAVTQFIAQLLTRFSHSERGGEGGGESGGRASQKRLTHGRVRL